MTTSLSDNYTVTESDIITQALNLLVVLGLADTVPAEDYAAARARLNAMVKTWQADARHLWTQDSGVLYLTDGERKYNLSTAAASASASQEDTTFLTQLSVALVGAETSITVDDTTGMTAGDYLEIVLDDDTRFATTITTVTSSTVLALNSAVTGAASADNYVFSFTTKLSRPLRIHEVRLASGIGTSVLERPLQAMSRQEYLNVPNKLSSGVPTAYYYDPKLDAGKLYIWPVPNDPTYRLHFTYERQIYDFDSTSNNPDFPQEWTEALVYGLAARIGPMYGKAGSPNYATLVAQAAAFREQMLKWDTEVEDVTIYHRGS